MVNILQEFKTLGEFLNWAEEYFGSHDIYYGHGTDNPSDEALMLALYVIQPSIEADGTIPEQNLTLQQCQQLIDLVQRRVAERIPVPYLTNEAWFAGERYYVNRDVIIPRSPIAELIANHFQPWLGKMQPKHILDMCTGSGCIAIYTAKQFPAAQVDAVDISAAALRVARKNIALHHCEKRVQAIESDLFAALSTRKYDIIISNPPYVDEDEMADLPEEYRHEPVLALASGTDGLELTIKLLREAANYLNPQGLLIVEVGYSWPTLAEKYPNTPFTWLEFEHGGEGVFLLTANDLKDIKL